jgi:hypothetical protein
MGNEARIDFNHVVHYGKEQLTYHRFIEKYPNVRVYNMDNTIFTGFSSARAQ